MSNSYSKFFIFYSILAIGLAGCSRSPSQQIQGYVEGEFVYISSPLSGTLESLHVKQGAQVNTGDPLFELESTSEKAAYQEAEQRLAQAQANLEDLKKGKRPSEIESLESQILEAKAVLTLSEKELARQKKLMNTPGAISQDDYDKALSKRDQDSHKVAQLTADFKTAQLGARTEQVAQAEAEIHVREAQLTKAKWNLSQKLQMASQDALVFDTLYSAGEWINAGYPIVVLLPPQNIKVRTFVPETQISKIHVGDSVQIIVDGLPNALAGKVNFISPQAEYTPPVIYSKSNRAKLVFLVEVFLDNPAITAQLHPGQPVDVQFSN